jgi:SRSO17 transposase
VNETLGMNPAQAVLADIELTGVVTDDDGIGQKAMRLDAAPQGSFGSNHDGIGIDLESQDAKPVEMRSPGELIGEDLVRMFGQARDHRPGEGALAHIGQRLGIDDIIVMASGAQQIEEVAAVGVAAQYASALGKTANCQTLVSLTLARGEVPVMLALRLFLPESWTSNRARLERAGVPAEYRTARTKPEMALAEIDCVAAGVRFGCVLADAGYGLSAPFRQGLTARKLAWAVGIPRHLKVYPADVQMIWPVAKRGRPRKRHVPDILSMAAEDMLADAGWQNISWRTGTKGKLKARFAAVRVRVADGRPQRIRDKGQQHLPGDEAWLIGEHRLSGEKKYYLAHLPAKTDLRNLAATIKARWICEQAHQQKKEELGLDHFEGRSWQGLHRHALMTMIAYAFLQHRRLAIARREKKNQRTPASANFTRRAPRHPRTHRSTTAAAMPVLSKMDLQRAAA